jgi:hypothetical protein
VKKTLCTLLFAVLTLVASLAAAQNSAYIRAADLSGRGHVVNTGAPKYCKPCLFYGGDWNSTASNWTAFGNTDDTVTGDDFQNFSPFKVKKAATASGLFTNNISTVGCVIDPAKALWSINTGVATGTGGKVIRSGESKATFVATGRSYSSYTECTAKVKIKATKLKAGKQYWEQVTPECTNSTDSNCSSSYYYETDTFDSTGTKQGSNHFGAAEAKDMSFAYSKNFSYNFVNNCAEGYSDPACTWMSAGVIGK